MTRRAQAALVGATAAVLVLAFTAGVLVAQTPPMQPGPGSGGTITHEQMHQMMDAMHGEGFSERMHQAVPGSEEMMEQCVAMMTMMGQMGGMMGGSGMPGMMGR